MQSVSSMIWTRVTVSIFNDINRYTTGASNHNDQIQPKCLGLNNWRTSLINQHNLAQSAGAVEYTDCTSAEG